MVIGHRAGEAAIAYEHGADIEALMPKLRHSDYFTEPKVQELAAMERAEPGYCRRVADFVVGRKVCGIFIAVACTLANCIFTAVVCLKLFPIQELQTPIISRCLQLDILQSRFEDRFVFIANIKVY